MTSTRTSSGVAVLSLALALLVVLLPTPPATRAAVPSAPGPCVAGWRELSIPDKAFLSTPFEVVTRKGKPAWILGGTNNGILALRWNGSAWRRTATTTSGHRGLVGGVEVGDKRVLGVGYYRANVGNGNGSLKPISGRVVTSTWKNRFVPDPPGPRASLTDVVSQPGGKAWAVGTRLQSGKLRAYAARWTGKSWNRKEPAGGTGSGLTAVERTPSGAIWAVGWKEANPGRPRPFIVKFSGGRWVRKAAAPLEAGSAVLTDAHFVGGRNGYAVGYLNRVGSDKHIAILQHWDGSAWSEMELPWAEDSSSLPRSITVGDDGELWIAGTQPATNKREARGFIAHRKGEAWDVDVLGVPDSVRSEVMDVAALSGGRAIAAGSVGASLLVLQTCDESTAALAGGTPGGGFKNQIKVGDMARRRAATDDDGHHNDLDGEAGTVVVKDDDPTAFSVSGGETGTDFALTAPIKPVNFFVRDKAGASGLAQSTRTFDGFAADFDGNGYRDVFIGRHGGVRPRLAMNYGGSFSEAATGAFSSVDRHGCDSSDVDKDGNKDIFCAVGASRGKAVQRHELSLAPNKASRELVKGGLGISDPLGRGRQAAFIRLDGDAYPELFFSNAPDRDDGLPGYNRFYRNDKGVFSPAPAVGLDTSHGAECISAGDFDQDGDEDLVYCTQYGFNGRAAGLRFMRNENGKLKDRTGGLGIRQIGDIDVAFGDVTGDGRKDLIQLNPDRVRVSERTSTGYRKIYEAKITFAWAVAVGDASGDGKADIYIARGTDKSNKPDRLLVSRYGGTRFNSVKIPQTSKGTADDVFALDYDKNGHDDFVVLNGRTKAGPVQLLASFPRS